MEPTTVKHKIDSSNKDSTDKEDDDIIPGLQDCDRKDSSSKNDSEYNQRDNDSSINTIRNNEDYLFNKNNNREDHYP